MADPVTRPRLNRVPPHDDQTERALLGASLLSRDAAQVLATLTPSAFHRPAHQHVAAAIGELLVDESPTDPGTVAAVLRRQGLLDAAGGANSLLEMQAQCPSTRSAPKWAEMLRTYEAQRRTLHIANEIADAIYKGISTDGLVAELHAASTAVAMAQESTWELVNLGRALAGEGASLVPVWLARTDGVACLYPGKLHSVIGEPESGKSWVVLLGSLQVMQAGGHVLYVDWEADAVTQVTRLLEMGADPELILERFHYLRPDEPHDKAAAMRVAAVMEAWPIDLAILDGLAEALALNGMDENVAKDVVAWYTAVARPIAAKGAAVVTVDHVVRDKDNPGRYARGSTAKLAVIDGAVYRMEVYKPFGRGLAGAARVVITKDRHGHIRAAAAGGKAVGEFHLTSSGDAVVAQLQPPSVAVAGGTFRPTRLMEKVSVALEGSSEPLSSGQVSRIVSGKKEHVLTALKVLVDEAFVAVTPGVRGSKMHRSVRPFRENQPATPPREEEF